MPPARKRATPAVVDAEVVELNPAPHEWDSEISLDEINAQVAEAISVPPMRRIRLRNGEVLEVRHAIALPDDRLEALQAVESGADLDWVENLDLRAEIAQLLSGDTLDAVWSMVEPHVRKPGDTIGGKPAGMQHIRLAKAFLGDEEYARLLAGGGNANAALHVFNQLNAATANAGSDPKSEQS